MTDLSSPGRAVITEPANIKQLVAFRKTSEAVALEAPGRKPLSYRGLFDQVDYVRRTLNDFGLGRGDRVALVLPNGPEMASAFLGVSACAACAPLNPGYRAEEFEFYLNDLDARALIVAAGSNTPAISVARKLGIVVLELNVDGGAPAGAFTLSGGAMSRMVERGFAGTEEVALLLHTSGTTSRPKLVPLLHANLCASARNVAHTLALTENDRCLSVMPLFHIHGLIGALLSSIYTGGAVVCAPSFDAARFFAWADAFNPTWYTAVPTMHQAILERAQGHADFLARRCLRLIRSSSAALPPRVMAELEAAFAAPVIEAYGMTEAAHQMASNPLPPGARKPGSVGRAAGPEIAVMDAAGGMLSHDQTGEIVIRGSNVMPGYASNAVANLDANVDANVAAFSAGWFRTGDQGYLDDDGYLFITGRLKEIINRGGEKISPREIDEALLNHDAIAQAVAFAVLHPLLGEDLAAAVVLKQNAQATEHDIREFLFGCLADFKVPSQVLIVDQIPKGATGKVQRIGLAGKLADFLKKARIAPRNEIERIVADLYAEVLKTAEFGVDDNFFALGGDSLRATQVAARIQAIFEIDLNSALIFRKPTVAELAAAVADMLASSDPESLEILLGLDSLPPEEMQQLLAETP
ncbi:MAG: AMP-binding protein [Burkholderiales bacterium]|nr:AMP-binding protein [Burkholderiales bacterium]